MADASSIVIIGPGGEQYELRSTRSIDGPVGWVVSDSRLAVSLLQSYLLAAEPGARQAIRMLRELVESWAPMVGLGSDLDDDEVTARIISELDHGDGGRVVLRGIAAPRVISEDLQGAELEVQDLVPLSEEAPVEEATTWFEVRLQDEVADVLADVPLSLLVDGVLESLTTDGGGVARFDDAHTSFATVTVADPTALRKLLVERWSEARDREWTLPQDVAEHTFIPYTEPLPAVPLSSKTPHTVVLQPRVSRARLAGAVFDTNKAFLLPSALHHVQSIRALYEQHPGAQLLIVGHTDTSGEVSYNETLSLERAESMKAYLTDDVHAWLEWYGRGKPSAKRWGEGEDQLMLQELLLRRGLLPTAQPVHAFQQSEGLTVDGIIGPNTRCALVTAYMKVDGTTLPPDIVPTTHGCGEAFPLADDGVSLDHTPRDGQDDPADRRVELFFFDAPLPILPPPPGPTSTAASPEYPTWRRRAQQTDDFVVRLAKALAVKVTDVDTKEPLAGAEVRLSPTAAVGADAKPGGGTVVRTDQFGVAVFVDLEDGGYQVDVERPSHLGQVVQHDIAPDDPPQVVSVALGAAVGDLVVSVTDEHSGGAVEGVDVRIDGPLPEGALTDASGTASFHGLPVGSYDIEVVAADSTAFSGSVTVVANSTESLEVKLRSTKPRQGNLAITVNDQAGNPVPGADVRLRDVAASPVQTDAKGEAMLGPVDEGDYELQALAEWFSLGTKHVTVTPDQTTLVVITLVPLKVELSAKLFWNRSWDYNDHTKAIGPIKEYLPMAKVELRIKPKGAAALVVHATDFADKGGAVSFKAVPRADAIELRVWLEHEGGKVVAFKGETNAVTQADFEVKTNKVAWHQFPLPATLMKKIDGNAAKVDLGDIEITKALFVDMCDCYKSIWFGHSSIKKLANVTLPYCELRYPSTTTSFHRGGKLYLLKDDLKDRDVLLHEYGHFITSKKVPGAKTQGYDYDDGNGTIGSHNRDSKEHYESSWTEGIATFLSCAMSDDPHYHDGYDTSMSYHLDTDNTQVGAHAEGSIQEALWETYKGQGVAFKKMWAALTNSSKMVVNTAVQFHENWSSLGIADHAKLVAAYHKFNMKYVYGYRAGGSRFTAVVAPKVFSAASKEFTTVDELYDNFGKLGGGTKADYLEEFYNRNKKFNAGALAAGSSRTNPKITAGTAYIVPERLEVK